MPYQASITKDEIAELPEFEYTGQVLVIESVKMLKQITPELLSENIWGFDTETKPNFIKCNPNPNRVSLLQLSNARCTYLFRLQKTGLPGILKHILSQPKIIKVGVAVKDDITGLQKIAKFEPAGFVDLQKEAEKFSIADKGLRNLTAIVLQHRMSKAQQLSNWENDVLNEKQILYAATDARVCRLIYEQFSNTTTL